MSHIISWWSMIVRVSVVLRRNVCGDIDWGFDNLSRIHHQGQGSWLWRCQCQSMSPQTVLLRSTLPQTIILHCVWTNMHWILPYSHFNSNFLQINFHVISMANEFLFGFVLFSFFFSLFYDNIIAITCILVYIVT